MSASNAVSTDVHDVGSAAAALLRAERDRTPRGRITTEILPAPELYYAEDYHQQYLAKNPNGYCGLGGTGVRYC